MLTGPFSSAQSMNITTADNRVEMIHSPQNSNPVLQAQLQQMQERIDRRQDQLDLNEDRIANIILNSPKSQKSEEKPPPEDMLAEKERQLRE